MRPNIDVNFKFPLYNLTGCPLTNQGLVCSYTGFCINCPFRLLLNVVSNLYDTDNSLGFVLRNILLKNYGLDFLSINYIY